MAGYMNNYGYPQQMNMNNQMSAPYYGYPNNMQSTIDRLEKLQNQQYQQQQMNYQQQQAQPQTNVNWVQVTNIQQAKEQIVQPNNTVWMMDSSLPRIYVKSVSPVGKIDFQPYQLVPLDENGNLPNNQQIPIQQEQMEDGQGYVPVEEFNKLTKTVNDLKQTIITLNQKIEMYEQLFQGQQQVEVTKTSGRRGGGANATESSK